MLKAQGLGYIRGGQEIIANLDLSVEPGESLAVIGPSGSGKTSLLALLSGLSRPTSGTVYIDGEPLKGFAGPSRGVALVLQGYGLVSLLTAAENIEIALRAAGRPAKTASKTARLVLTQLGLEAHADQLTEELSGGQQQRTAVARALALEPRLLIADEPTAELDPAARAVALARMFDIAEFGGSLILATHDPEVAARCDRILDLRSGQMLSKADLTEADQAEAVQPPTSQLEPFHPEPAHPEPAEPEIAEPEPAQPEAAPSEAAPPEAAQPGAAPSEAAPSEAAQPELARPELDQSESAPPESAPPESAPPESAPPESAPLLGTPPASGSPAATRPVPGQREEPQPTTWQGAVQSLRPRGIGVRQPVRPAAAQPAQDELAAAQLVTAFPAGWRDPLHSAGRHRQVSALPEPPPAHRRGALLRDYLEHVRHQAFQADNPGELLGFAELGLRLLELHQRTDISTASTEPAGSPARCANCGWRWPCPTFLTLLQILDDAPSQD